MCFHYMTSQTKSAGHVSSEAERSLPKRCGCLRRTASPIDRAWLPRESGFLQRGPIFCQRSESWWKATYLGSSGVSRAVWAEQPQEHTGGAAFHLCSAALLPMSTCGSDRGGELCFQGFVLFRVLWMRRCCFEAISTHIIEIKNHREATSDCSLLQRGLHTGLELYIESLYNQLKCNTKYNL